MDKEEGCATSEEQCTGVTVADSVVSGKLNGDNRTRHDAAVDNPRADNDLAKADDGHLWRIDHSVRPAPVAKRIKRSSECARDSRVNQALSIWILPR